eukprot:gene5612-6180_t
MFETIKKNVNWSSPFIPLFIVLASTQYYIHLQQSYLASEMEAIGEFKCHKRLLLDLLADQIQEFQDEGESLKEVKKTGENMGKRAISAVKSILMDSNEEMSDHSGTFSSTADSSLNKSRELVLTPEESLEEVIVLIEGLQGMPSHLRKDNSGEKPDHAKQVKALPGKKPVGNVKQPSLLEKALKDAAVLRDCLAQDELLQEGAEEMLKIEESFGEAVGMPKLLQQALSEELVQHDVMAQDELLQEGLEDLIRAEEEREGK